MSDMITHEPDCHGFENEQGRKTGLCKDMCYGHYRCEPMREGDYHVCGECFHVFRTPTELLDLHRDMLIRIGADPGEALATEQIFSCPVCAHDF